ncbi:MAG: phosphoglycerate kinase [Acidobacteria bacterium]|nr:phosphoglycerate kinase [Acidobacteriota bacterium]
MSKLSIRDLYLKGKRVFLRVDFNVPLDDGKVADDTRIRAVLPTLALAREKEARVVLASHLGRPKAEREESFSLRPVALHLAALLGQEVGFTGETVGPAVEQAVDRLGQGEILLLENLRFHSGETKNTREFGEQLSRLADEYVNDAFGAAHRAHASIVGVPAILGRGAAGLLMERELDYLSRVLTSPQKPIVAIFGGAKISDKIDVIENFLNFADTILLGGGMAFTFFRARGWSTGNSIVEEDKVSVARELLQKAQQKGVKVLLPRDNIMARELRAGIETRIEKNGIAEGWMGLDIGPRAIREFRNEIARAKTIIWNGPLGVFEVEDYSRGTLEVARAIAAADALSVVGGGDSVSAVMKAGVQDRISHISTGGGASLEFLAGKKLPGVEVLTDK